jgi:putative membrane protein
MKNIFRIIISDFRGLGRSFIAMILVIAILFLPALYSWSNIYACWDPYENVSGIAIAIYTEDEDYTKEDGTVINVSNNMLDELRDTSDIGWTLVDTRDEAVDGVYDGTYYASVVIEKDFTRSMFDFDNVGENEPSVTFYQNQKKNAIATRMTDSAANKLKSCMTKAYIKALMSEIFGYFNEWNTDIDEADSDIDSSQSELLSLKQNMQDYESTLSAFINANKLLVGTTDETDMLVDDAVSSIYSSVDSINRQNEIIKSMQDDLQSDVNDATDSLTTLQQHMDDLSDIVTRISEVDTLNDISKMLDDTETLLKTIKDSLKNIQKLIDAALILDSSIDTIGEAACDSLDYLLNQTDYLLDYLETNYDGLIEFQSGLTANLGNIFTSAVQSNPNYAANYQVLSGLGIAGFGPTDSKTFVTAILLANSGVNLQEIYTAYSDAGVKQALQAASQSTAGKTDTELLVQALTILANDDSVPTETKTGIASILNAFSTLNNIQSRAGELKTQYQSVSSKLPSLLYNAGALLEDFGMSTGTDTMNALNSAIQVDLKDTIDQLSALQNLGSGSSSASKSDITAARSKVKKTKLEVEAMRLAFRGIETDAPDVDADDAIEVINDLLDRLDEIDGVLTSAQKLLDTTGDATEVISQLNDLSTDTINYINATLQPTINKTLSDMSEVMDEISALLIHAANTMEGGKSVLDGVSLTMMGVNNSLGEVQNVLGLLSERISPIIDNIDELQNAEIIADLRTLLGLDPDAVSDYIASPVDAYTESVYSVENYGSGMAPFYTSLAIWIGNIILAALFKTQPSTKGLKNPKTWQLYFGRYFLFFLFNEIQAVIIMLGDLYLLKIQCENPGLFMLTGIFASMAFSILTYTLTLSFGILGKAASVLLFILQIAGSGGTYPIELLPSQFQALHVFLPFDYSIGALRSAIAGTYQNDIYVNLGVLLLIVAGSIYIGFKAKVFRGFTDYMEEQMEESNLMTS